MDSPPALRMEGISKEFHGNAVLRGVDLEVAPGQIVCLVGENGAGKSTLMNILFGMPVIRETGGFRGRILLAGLPVDIRSPRDAMDHGIGMIHQEFMLLPGFSITENIKLNRERLVSGTVARLAPGLATLDWPRMEAEAREALDKVGLEAQPSTPAGALPVGHKQFVEIAREVDRQETRLLVFDEPSAVLTESEAERLLETMRRLAGEGIAMLFITHRLDEVLEVADRIIVLRDGEKVGELSGRGADVATIARLMVGRSIDRPVLPPRPTPPSDAALVLAIEGLEVDMPGEPVRGLDLSVRRGEVLGIGGLAGQGKLGVANGCMGLCPRRGRVTKDGRDVAPLDPIAALRAGMAFLSEDRRGVGLLLDESIALNIVMTSLMVQRRFLEHRVLGLLPVLDARDAREHALAQISALDIRCTGPDQPVRQLSGGNQQKVCIARAITLGPDLLFVSEPTRGVDVGAKKRILDTLVGLNRSGVTVVMTSSELAELRMVCDRVAIVSRGRVAAVLDPDAADDRFGMAMAGVLH